VESLEAPSLVRQIINRQQEAALQLAQPVGRRAEDAPASPSA
jgi:hypothetical protein